jgi:hypothetical protein
MPDLAISPENVAFLIVKAREFDAKEANSDPDSGSNPTDDNMIDVSRITAPIPSRARSRASSMGSAKRSRLIWSR